MRKTIVLAAVNMSLAVLVLGCGESLPQKSLQGGIMSGTEVQRQRYSTKQDPILAGNGPQMVGPTAAVANPQPATPMTPMPMNHASPTGPAPSPATDSGQ